MGEFNMGKMNKNDERIDWKEKSDKAAEIVESCWDNNNPNDGKTFEERLKSAIAIEEDIHVRNILLAVRS